MPDDPSISLRVELYRPSGDGNLSELASSLRDLDSGDPDEQSGNPHLLKVLIKERLPITHTMTTTDDSTPVSPSESSSKIGKLLDILSAPDLAFEALYVKSEGGWLGINSFDPIVHDLRLSNVWVGNDSLILENLVKLRLDCNSCLSDRGPLTGEWLLTMLNRTKNLEDCTLHLEPARIVGSNVCTPPDVELKMIENFDVSYHHVQIQTLFSKLTLPETARVKISTATNVGNRGDLARVVFPPEWPTSEQAWKQKKLDLYVSKDAVTYHIGDNHTVTVGHDDALGPRSLVPFVISGHGYKEYTSKEVEVWFARGFEGFGPLWWDNILGLDPGPERLVCSKGKIQDLCDALGGGGYKKCPGLRRLELREVDFAVDKTTSALTQMLSKRKEFDCPIEELYIHGGLGAEAEGLSEVQQCVERYGGRFESRGEDS